MGVQYLAPDAGQSDDKPRHWRLAGEGMKSGGVDGPAISTSTKSASRILKEQSIWLYCADSGVGYVLLCVTFVSGLCLTGVCVLPRPTCGLRGMMWGSTRGESSRKKRGLRAPKIYPISKGSAVAFAIR